MKGFVQLVTAQIWTTRLCISNPITYISTTQSCQLIILWSDITLRNIVLLKNTALGPFCCWIRWLGYEGRISDCSFHMLQLVIVLSHQKLCEHNKCFILIFPSIWIGTQRTKPALLINRYLFDICLADVSPTSLPGRRYMNWQTKSNH